MSESEMNRMQQEAARRVNEMHSRARSMPQQKTASQASFSPPASQKTYIPSTQASQTQTPQIQASQTLPPKPKPPQAQTPPAGFSAPCATPPIVHSGSGDILENLMNDKERNLILLMIILLMGEDCDQALLLALLYLLI